MAELKLKELIEELTSKEALWTASETSMSSLNETQRRKILSQEEPLKGMLLAEAKVPTPTYGLLVDWRNRNGKNHVSVVKNQASCGSCVSFSTVAVTESMTSIEKGILPNLSEADQHFCSSHGANCSGWNDAAALGQIKARGVCSEAMFPYASAFPNNDPNYYYNHAAPPNPKCIINPNRNKSVHKVKNVVSLGANQIVVKNFLSGTGPVTCDIAVYTDFFNYKSGIYHHVSGKLEGYHSMAVIGYSEIGQYWICKNSWGTGWGMAGFINIAFGQCNIDVYGKYGATGIILP
ncbi:MAG: C1 family peptidase [Ignavibacteria bacterium]|nr:C1 family peptidase [Ignavibacteria bacterium]